MTAGRFLTSSSRAFHTWPHSARRLTRRPARPALTTCSSAWKAAILKVKSMTDHDDIISLGGRLPSAEVTDVEQRHRARFDSGRFPLAVSLDNVESGDSSALALLLEWQALARRAGREIRFENPPQGLRVIARLTGIEQLLGWQPDSHHSNTGQEQIGRAHV